MLVIRNNNKYNFTQIGHNLNQKIKKYKNELSALT